MVLLVFLLGKFFFFFGGNILLGFVFFCVEWFLYEGLCEFLLVINVFRDEMVSVVCWYVGFLKI